MTNKIKRKYWYNNYVTSVSYKIAISLLYIYLNNVYKCVIVDSSFHLRKMELKLNRHSGRRRRSLSKLLALSVAKGFMCKSSNRNRWWNENVTIKNYIKMTWTIYMKERNSCV